MSLGVVVGSLRMLCACSAPVVSRRWAGVVRGSTRLQLEAVNACRSPTIRPEPNEDQLP